MASTHSIEEVIGLDDLGNVVPEGYEYYEKLVRPREGLQVLGAYFKWYDIYPPDVEITQEQFAECRDFLLEEAQARRLNLEGELGFVLLHRAGKALLLLVTTWRNTNEMWLSLYMKEAGTARDYTPITFAGGHRGTYCVWELGPVWHERGAWVRFIQSKRDSAAKLAYIHDSYAGKL